MNIVFISLEDQPTPRWKAAFPDLSLVQSVGQYLRLSSHSGDICFFDSVGCSSEEAKTAIRRLSDQGVTVVGLSGTPSDAEAYGLLTAGARGYCHVDATPEQLSEVANVVAVGGFWMPPGLVQRLVSSALKVTPELPQPPPEGFDQLTEREYQVAMAVGKGANNKEIAEELEVSERTVKAHLTSIFDKLNLRDRVQLALAVNRLPFH